MFSNKHYLIIHQRSQSGEKPFKCEQCDKCFADKCTLVTYQRAYYNEKPFECDQCDICSANRIGLVMMHQSTLSGGSH